MDTKTREAAFEMGQVENVIHMSMILFLMADLIERHSKEEDNGLLDRVFAQVDRSLEASSATIKLLTGKDYTIKPEFVELMKEKTRDQLNLIRKKL